MTVGIIGTGIAGLRVAAELRERGFTGRIVAWDGEGTTPYDRPPLSKHLFDAYHQPLAEQGLGDLAQLHVTVHAAVVAAVTPAADLAAHHHAAPSQPDIRAAGGWDVHVAERKTLSGTDRDAFAPISTAGAGTEHVDTLVVATGSRPRLTVPGAAPLYTLAMAEHLRSRIHAGTRVDIVGAGWIGTELSDSISRRGAHVTVWERSPHVLGRAFHGAVDDLWRGWMDERHITLHLGTVFPGAPADHVVIQAVGAEPALEFMPAGVDRSPHGALAVDWCGRVLAAGKPVPGLYAAGDAAAVADSGGWRSGGHWTQALADAQRVGADITGTEPPAFVNAPEVFSDQFGHSLGFIGEAPEGVAPERDAPQDDALVLRWRRNGQVTGVLTVDAPHALSRARRAMRRPLADLTQTPTPRSDRATPAPPVLTEPGYPQTPVP
ncbi:FAD-dependent oxidoreductase [Neoactinobaculum massilliense]|uniref:FAD-dependent oxidoreductase n=1 Tax=Neoactinobaculum massilliense TaxID=2364794 RepID=UPI000F53766A|nr:FAD-dependent oxidoreductase [Neoactinobaculum massilliense]